MKIKFRNLLKDSSILSVPGLISILISLLSIPIHLNYAGPESYGNYIIFQFVLLISIIFNFGIGKSTVISINNYIKKKKEIGYEAIAYTKKISLIIIFFYFLLVISDKLFLLNFINIYKFTLHLLFGSIITIFFISLEGILQGNRKFKFLSILNLFFFGISFTIPSILLFYKNDLTLKNLIEISLLIKFFSVIVMFLVIKKSNLIKKSKCEILLNNLKINSKWITVNSILIQFYDLFDKYLIKIFLGPIAVATYSIPQQLTGKLTIISKSFSAFLLPDLSKKKSDNEGFIFSLEIFIKIIPLIIFILMPLYPFILKLWLGNSYNLNILNLTKVFSLCVIFSCTSHILVTKFEASKILYQNLKIEFFLMPIFIIFLVFLTAKNYSLLHIGILVLIKECILFFIRINFLKYIIKNVKKYYLISIYFIIMLLSSFYNENLYYCLLIILIFNSFRK